ncbi:MAG TPA: DUF305 domain-containing protein [Gemmatimonadales bacterium]|jgi:uncharacterized protein (DUF305 family)
MSRLSASSTPRLTAALLLTLLGGGAASTLTAQSKPDFVKADVDYMQGMIVHHAQALEMCVMAPSHGASDRVALFCKKVMISQRDEINQMAGWLKARGQAFPDTAAGSDMPGMVMKGPTLMPGMLTPAQMTTLGQAHGTTWDSLFLVDMIQHHTGAIGMVKTLFDANGGQEPEIFGYATGVDNDQRAEIDRMQKLLTTYQRSSPQ